LDLPASLRKEKGAMAIRNIYLKIQSNRGYCPVAPDTHVSPPIQYGRDCMRNMNHEDGTIPPDEIAARRVNALVYREYLDAGYLIPKPDKIVVADINEPAYNHRVPGTVIYTQPGERLRIHVKNADIIPHSFHVHGLKYGIDSDGSWPFGTQSADGRRSDEICPGQTWIYTYDVTDEMFGAWPFHDHHRDIGMSVNRGLFGGIIVLPRDECERLPRFPLPEGLEKELQKHHHSGHSETGHKSARESSGKSMATMAMAPMAGGMGPGLAHDMDLEGVPEELLPYVILLDELAHASQAHHIPRYPHVLHVPIFLHQMSGARGKPAFQSAPITAPSGVMGGGTFTSPTFTFATVYQYICGIHGATMAGQITVQVGGPATAAVSIVDFQFVPANVIVGVGGTVIWTNHGPSLHSVVEQGGDSMPSYCMNGRAFIGNTPTILADAGQKIRWYIFNLDLGMGWHNFHTHSQRWRFGNETIDVRSIGPAESFVMETIAPPVLLLPPEIEKAQHPEHRHHHAKPYHLRGDFLFHCHVEMHMMQGLAGLVRSRQTVWLTPAEKALLESQTGLPLDMGDNDCPPIQIDRCANSTGGKWEELPGLPQITMMHTLLLANSSRVLFWGYGPLADHARIWDQTTGLFTMPANQPAAISTDENIWSGAHAYLNDAAGTILLFGGYHNGPTPPLSPDTERRAFLFNPTSNSFSHASDLHAKRFYPTCVTLPDGRAMTLFGQDTIAGTTTASLEVFTPGGAGTWTAPKALPFNFFYYPWTFVLPNGELFIAGPQKPARRFDWTATPVIDDPAKQYNQIASQRGVNMDGTAVLLPLRPPHHAARIFVAGGQPADAMQSAEWIDLSVLTPKPAWQALPDMNVPRDKVNSVLLPDGRVFIAGGIDTLVDGGPAEIFDPEDPNAGFELGPSMKYKRGYHSTAILLPDGSVLVGGDPNGGTTPCERYRPSYFFKPRPSLISAPATVAHGAAFSIDTPTPAGISEVVLMRPGAVTHAFNQAQRYVGCAITGTSATAVNATMPPNGNVAPPGYYLLFVVDHDRVPSEGRWIRLTP
jgi:FtsP/CotA-like multicopper oxidase with cupredoxin domain